MSTGAAGRPDVTVVIPTLGRPILQRTLDAIAAGTRQPAEVIVVDQGQSPDIGAMVRGLVARGVAARWIPSTQRGRARGVNRGIEASTTRFVAITDDDCLVHPDWLERLAAKLEEDPGSIVTGRVEAGDATVLSAVTSRMPVVQRRPSPRFDRLSGGNMGLARSVVTRIGGLDEDPTVRTAEDAEYAYRALRAGVAIRYAPDVTVTHLGWRDDNARGEQYADYARSHGGFYGKYLRRGDAFIALRALLHWARATRRWAASALRGDRERARAARAYVVGLFAGIKAGWIQAGRTRDGGLPTDR
jgi:GT2 family glycosyltransferase